MTYQVGSLVKTRGREWVVQPETGDDWLILRPLGGTDVERTGIFLPLEGDDVYPATFHPPEPGEAGDFQSARLLRDAVRLGFRSSAGPFRSFARIAVEPRPYQLVPLLMALRLDPVRMLIADDVGIGKTIEAGLIARELLDRAEVSRLAVLCPPYLAEQWQAELAEKFHIDAELVLPSTVNRLERNTAVGQSLFDLYPFVVVSTDYIKSSRRRDDFVRGCPELVIIDEAHNVAFNKERRSGRHLRHQLASELAADPARHLILTTATPHSGDEGAFRSLLGLLKPEFARLPEDLTGKENEQHRRDVARHMVQRRRADIRAYMETDTAFPEREDTEAAYMLSNEYKKLFGTILDYARERVTDESGSRQQQRVRWWSSLALLRSLASSPAAAAATLRTRSGTAETDTVEEADEVGERSVLDLTDTDASEYLDVAPGGLESEDDSQDSQRERLLRYARRAEGLFGPEHDLKLAQAIEIVKSLLKDGYNPIVFCRFIPTAEYVAEQLRDALPRGTGVMAVTGTLAPAEREKRVDELGEFDRRVLVATDCLSEGINLQEHFNAVMHYDLSWNPTRHEQREGRVDRFGQPQPVVRTITYYGTDNQIDGIVLDVLLRKHKAIRSSLGISVPVPADSNEVVQALMQGLILRGRDLDNRQLSLFGNEVASELQLEWENVSVREKQSRTMFAQRTIQVDEVAREWAAMREAIGTGIDVEQFVTQALDLHDGFVEPKGNVVELHLPNLAAVREAMLGVGNNHDGPVRARFELPVGDGVVYLSRTHPLVEGLASYVMDTALDPLLDGKARRAGAIRTRAVDQLTTVLLLRFRYHITTGRLDGDPTPLLAEEAAVAAFTGLTSAPAWLAQDKAESLLAAQPAGNVSVEQATRFLERQIDGLAGLQDDLGQMAAGRAATLQAAHARVRASSSRREAPEVEPQLPVDVLGLYVLIPAGG